MGGGGEAGSWGGAGPPSRKEPHCHREESGGGEGGGDSEGEWQTTGPGQSALSAAFSSVKLRTALFVVFSPLYTLQLGSQKSSLNE